MALGHSYEATRDFCIALRNDLRKSSPRAHGVRVNCICPAGVYTDMVTGILNSVWEGRYKPPQDLFDSMPKTHEAALKIYLKPSDVVNEVMKLINDESKNGQVLLITKDPEGPMQVKVENIELK
ncbi:Hypothetical predicted protein [Paramuricea clavata]|uniref:Uncharacterized protein n=1 Tax=Paramuricea clavata TaxID=317549 RepID=A0A6S7H8Y4_PARCT|nr:Hypothetical predicted protein [Paramuricea clavata]